MKMCTDNPDIPRRIRVDLATPIEREIRDLRNKIEGMGAHPLLTDAVVLMGNVLSKMADYVELDKGEMIVADEQTEAKRLREVCKVAKYLLGKSLRNTYQPGVKRAFELLRAAIALEKGKK